MTVILVLKSKNFTENILNFVKQEGLWEKI